MVIAAYQSLVLPPSRARLPPIRRSIFDTDAHRLVFLRSAAAAAAAAALSRAVQMSPLQDYTGPARGSGHSAGGTALACRCPKGNPPAPSNLELTRIAPEKASELWWARGHNLHATQCPRNFIKIGNLP